MIVGLIALPVSAARVGFNIPGLERFRGILQTSELNYSHSPGPVSQLAPGFVESRLGGFGPTAQKVHPGDGPEPRRMTVPGDPPARTVIDHQAHNDEFKQAYSVGAIPFTARTDARNAGRENEPAGCAPLGGTVWYRYTPRRDMGLIANTVGTRQATALGVFTGSSPDHLTQVPDACHRSPGGSAYVTFRARAGITYHFQITNVTEAGPVVFNLDPFGTTSMVSPHPNATAGWHRLAANGRYAVFSSAASDLVPGDRNGVEDQFVRDLHTGHTERVSVSSGEAEGNGESKAWLPGISADGRYVAFTSDATNLAPGDTNEWEDVFVRDRLTGETTRVSVSSSGQQGSKPVGGQGDPWAVSLRRATSMSDEADAYGSVAISGDGRYVAFDSDLTGLVPEDPAGADDELVVSGTDVFVHDRVTGRTSMASVSPSGENGNAHSGWPVLSYDGRYVAFVTAASNIVPSRHVPYADEHPWVRFGLIKDVVVRDLTSGLTELVSVAYGGGPANERSYIPAISADGRYVAFASQASDLVPNDENEVIDVFVRDRHRNVTEIVSLTSTGDQQIASETVERGGSRLPTPSISADGRYVTFHSDAPNLVTGETDQSAASVPAQPACNWQREEAFVRDRLFGITTRVSVTPSGSRPNGASVYPSISADGRTILFASVASDIVEEDRPATIPYSCLGALDVFAHTFPVLR